ncbi:SAM-dependent methyltransferase [Actinoplanes sp. NPDC049265]|uniref:SAM-dependent methyltransferase n=1 Tax=Actinoplanes sp. NPDC049265 TaxID=3363902 RepID=UPI003720AC18
MAEPLDTGRPHPARVYDYLLGGKDNFAVDRAAAAEGLEVNPNAATAPLENRAFMRRVVRYLAGEAGISQFLDIGTGLPTSPNVHESAQAVNPAARIVYVDNDPIVLTHARALLTSAPEGRTAYVDAAVQQADQILRAPGVRDNLDTRKPVAVLLMAILHFIPDDDAYDIIPSIMDALPSGSYVALSHVTADHDPDGWAKFTAVMRRQGLESHLRGRAGVERFFDRLELVEPGVVPILSWRPDGATDLTDAQVALYGGVARKR